MHLGRLGGWKPILLRSLVISSAMVLANLLTVSFCGSTISLYAGYFLGNSFRSMLGTLLFVESLAILGLGAVWASGAMEAEFDGSNIATNPYYRREQFKQRSDELDQESIAGKVMLFVGAPVLVVSLILFFA
jgi:hypothetical protein